MRVLWLLLGAGVAGAIALVAASSESERATLGFPDTARTKFRPSKQSGQVLVAFDGKPLPDPTLLPSSVDILGSPSLVPTQANLAEQQKRQALAERNPVLRIYDAFRADINAEWLRRRKSLPPKAQASIFVDEWSTGLYDVPAWYVTTGALPKGHVTRDVAINQATGVLVDEYGRLKPGQYGTHANLWDQTIGGLLKNPLGAFALWAAVLYFGGPAGLAAYGSYALWQNRGQQFSLTDTAVAAARAALVAECGPACGVAFDMGVGVLQGKRLDQAAEDALVSELSPAERAAFEKGKNAYRKMRAR